MTGDALRFTLLSDGSSDRALLPMIRWLLQRRGVLTEGSWADPGRFPQAPKTLAEKIAQTLVYYPCDVLFVHRDAEGQAPARRKAEILEAVAGRHRHVPVVPVRMMEAWLLFDEQLIRHAAGNPAGRMPLALPALQRLEALANPKDALFELLRLASGLNDRRLARFNVHERRLRVADLAEDFSPLLQLAAFREFDEAVGELVAGHAA